MKEPKRLAVELKKRLEKLGEAYETNLPKCSDSNLQSSDIVDDPSIIDDKGDSSIEKEGVWA